MKRILFVIDSLKCGGAEKSLISLLNLIDYDKYKIDLQLYNPKGMFNNLVPKFVNVLPNLQFYDFCNLSLKKQITTLRLNNIISKLKLSYAIRNNKKNLHGAQLFWNKCESVIENLNENYDVAIAYNQGFSTYFVSEKVKADKKLAWVNTDYIEAGYDPKIDFKFYEKFDNIIAVSKGSKKVLESCFFKLKDRIIVIEDINNAKVIVEMSKNKTVFEEVNEDIIKIVTVGRLVPSKGYDLAIDAGNILSKENIKFKWYVIGDGSEKSNIEKYIQENNLQYKFILKGAVDNPYPYIKNADIYVQTSRFEGFGLAIAEARILNTPVVTTNFDAVYNQIIDGKNGLVVNMNGEDIAKGIIKIVKDKNLKNNLTEYLKTEKKGNIEEIDKFYKLINN